MESVGPPPRDLLDCGQAVELPWDSVLGNPRQGLRDYLISVMEGLPNDEEYDVVGGDFNTGARLSGHNLIRVEQNRRTLFRWSHERVPPVVSTQIYLTNCLAWWWDGKGRSCSPLPTRGG